MAAKKLLLPEPFRPTKKVSVVKTFELIEILTHDVMARAELVGDGVIFVGFETLDGDLNKQAGLVGWGGDFVSKSRTFLMCILQK